MGGGDATDHDDNGQRTRAGLQRLARRTPQGSVIRPVNSCRLFVAGFVVLTGVLTGCSSKIPNELSYAAPSTTPISPTYPTRQYVWPDYSYCSAYNDYGPGSGRKSCMDRADTAADRKQETLFNQDMRTYTQEKAEYNEQMANLREVQDWNKKWLVQKWWANGDFAVRAGMVVLGGIVAAILLGIISSIFEGIGESARKQKAEQDARDEEQARLQAEADAAEQERLRQQEAQILAAETAQRAAAEERERLIQAEMERLRREEL